jgi:hypothetical protein
MAKAETPPPRLGNLRKKCRKSPNSPSPEKAVQKSCSLDSTTYVFLYKPACYALLVRASSRLLPQAARFPRLFSFQKESFTMSTAQQVAANQANAQLSTGPRTEEGKKRSSLNALKTGLTGRTVLLPSEDAEAYRAYCQTWMDAHKPAGQEETDLVQSLADNRWRQDRAFALEQNLFALGHVEFAGLFSQELPEVRNSLIHAHTFRAYLKEFRSLLTQQGRLDRCFHRDLAKLAEIQQTRKQIEATRAAQLRKAAAAYTAATKERAPLAAESFNPAQNGFEFSIAEIEEFLTAPNGSARPQIARAA